MDTLHREHEFITNIWQWMKSCEQRFKDTEAFWNHIQSEGATLALTYYDLTFAPDWVASFLKYLDDSHRREDLNGQQTQM